LQLGGAKIGRACISIVARNGASDASARLDAILDKTEIAAGAFDGRMRAADHRIADIFGTRKAVAAVYRRVGAEPGGGITRIAGADGSVFAFRNVCALPGGGVACIQRTRIPVITGNRRLNARSRRRIASCFVAWLLVACNRGGVDAFTGRGITRIAGTETGIVADKRLDVTASDAVCARIESTRVSVVTRYRHVDARADRLVARIAGTGVSVVTQPPARRRGRAVADGTQVAGTHLDAARNRAHRLGARFDGTAEQNRTGGRIFVAHRTDFAHPRRDVARGRAAQIIRLGACYRRVGARSGEDITRIRGTGVSVVAFWRVRARPVGERTRRGLAQRVLADVFEYTARIRIARIGGTQIVVRAFDGDVATSVSNACIHRTRVVVVTVVRFRATRLVRRRVDVFALAGNARGVDAWSVGRTVEHAVAAIVLAGVVARPVDAILSVDAATRVDAVRVVCTGHAGIRHVENRNASVLCVCRIDLHAAVVCRALGIVVASAKRIHDARPPEIAVLDIAASV
jgi:hypothetical protein